MKALFRTVLSILSISLFIIACSSDSEEPIPQPDTIAPTVDFSIAGFPNSSSNEPIVVSNQIEININTEDAGGIQKVEAFINDEKVGEDTSAPYQIIVDVSGFASKNAITGKFTDYTLKIVVTDTSGNTNSEELIFNVDNELPMVSEVSLESGTIINGDSNLVTFNVSDNEVLKEVKTFLNDELLSEITDLNYEVNINTLSLQDGENTFKIEAVDLAENTATFEVDFISDNTGPQILISDLEANQILDEQLLLQPVVQDEYSEVVSFSFSFNSVTILESTSSDIGTFEINPEELEIGEVLFEALAIDELGNETSLNFTAQVLRKLFTIEMEDGFFENNWFGFYILISEMDGSFIALEQADINDIEITIHAPGEFALDKEYMVSFIAEENTGGNRKTHFTTVQHLTRDNFNSIQFEAPFGNGISQTTIPMSGFEVVENFLGRGQGYQSSFNQDLTEFNIEQYSGNGFVPYDSFYIIGYSLGDNPLDYGYLKIDNPIDPSMVIEKSDFILDNIVRGSVDFSANVLPNYDANLFIWGFEQEEDFEAGQSHLVHAPGFLFGPVGTRPYAYPNIFERYSHHFRLNNYNTFRTGLPTSEYLIPNWSIDHTQNGNEISILKSGTGYGVGRLIIEIGGSNDSQLMALVFDSSEDGPIFMPQLPEELSNLRVYDVFQNQTFSVDYSELISFDSLPTYEEYLNQVISTYKEHTEVAPMMESLTNRNAFIFNNWSFKYQ